MTAMRVACNGVLVLACVSGCMTTPFDGQEVPDMSAPVEFSGYTVKPNQEVRVYSLAGHASELLVGSTRTVDAPITPFPGDTTQFYPWRFTAVVPGWNGVGPNGHYALVAARAVDPDASEIALPTAGPDGLVCVVPQPVAASGLSDDAPGRRVVVRIRNNVAGPLEIHMYDLGTRGMRIVGLTRPAP